MAKRKYGRLSRNKHLLILLLAVLFLSYCYLPLVVKLKKLDRLIETIEAEITKFKKDNLCLEKEKKRLNLDLGYIDRIARENLDLMRSGEILYKIVQERLRGGAAR